jgi:hypothetical protein
VAGNVSAAGGMGGGMAGSVLGKTPPGGVAGNVSAAGGMGGRAPGGNVSAASPGEGFGGGVANKAAAPANMRKVFKDETDKAEGSPSLGNTEEAMEVSKGRKGMGSAKDMASLLGLQGLQER